MRKKDNTKSNIAASIRARLYNLTKEYGRDFNAVVLQNRYTRLEDRTILFHKNFKQLKEKQEQWTAFLSRNHLESIVEFSKMVDTLEQFIEPVCSYQKCVDEDKIWNAKSWKWL